MCKLGALYKARLRKVYFSGDFPGVFDFFRIACSLRVPLETFKFNRKSPIFTNTPCKSSFLYNARARSSFAFFVVRNFLVFLSVFPFFPRDFRGVQHRETNPCFFGWVFLAFAKKKGKEDQG